MVNEGQASDTRPFRVGDWLLLAAKENSTMIV